MGTVLGNFLCLFETLNACLCSSGLAELAQWKKKKDVSICKRPLSYNKKITNS